MNNPLTGQPIPNTYEVTINYGKRPVFTVTLKTTREAEAVAQAAKV